MCSSACKQAIADASLQGVSKCDKAFVEPWVLLVRPWPLAKDQATTGQKEPGNQVNLKAGQPVLTGQILKPRNRANVGGPSGPPNPRA